MARITRRAVPQLAPTTKLEDLGLSSIDRVELMSALEDRYQVELDESGFAAATTVADLERMLHAAAVPQADDVARSPSTGLSGGPVEGDPATSGESLASSRDSDPRRPPRWPCRWARTFVYYAFAYP